MAHAIWSGAINFGLVNIPVRLFSAVRANELRFHLLHAKDLGRIHNERVCEICGKKVKWDDLVRGYEYEKGNYVTVSDEDLKKANVEATQSVTIQEFVALDEIDPILFDTPYYLEPDKRGRHAYALLREALKKSGKVGISRVVIRTREHLAALRPSGDMLLLELMHWADEIVPSADLELPAEPPSKLPAPEMKAAMMLIDTMTTKFDAEEFHDRYREQVLAMIEARAEGKAIPKGKPAPAKTNVLDLMEVLQRSLAETKKRGAAPSHNGASSAASKHKGPAKARPHGRPHAKTSAA